MTLCFPFDSSIDNIGAPPSVELNGAVKSESKAEVRPWIRLVGVYSAQSKETQADESGRFAFSLLEEGLYAVVVTRSNMDPMIKLVRLTFGANRLEVSLP